MELANFFCITINDNRYNYICQTFDKYNLPIPVKFEGLRYEPSNVLGCLYSHMSLLMMCRCLGCEYYVCFEDDAYPRRDAREKVEFYIEHKPKDCGILVLGENGEWGKIDWTQDKNYFTVVERPFGAHAYIVYKPAYDELLMSFERTRIADIALRGKNFKTIKPYWTKDLIFVQKNIDENYMTNQQRGNSLKGIKYFYPDVSHGNKLGVFSEKPNDFFD